ncbi:hypothetical protein JTE90_015149 [Oedothorax gibbosus]|uniref:Methionyl-tRNA formyltransferase, mitochondrial n=1 Tax=Oedothorax gibbosus TaxID=931172 RepID=A0AAV6VRS4_9ARAC|nr:hypothetical protein JTE90_015149 [Oedothorax gibbosus]
MLRSAIRAKVKPLLYKFKRRGLCSRFLDTQKGWKVVFYGTDNLSEEVLKALHANRISSNNKIVKELDVVCIKLDCAVRQYATTNNIPIHTWPYHLPPNTYDVGVVASFGHLIPSDCIRACKYGMINAHPSLLPRWRGAAPIVHTILGGDIETGVTITQVSPNKFDVGKILLQEKYKVPVGSSSKTLTDEMSKIAAAMIMKTLEKLPFYIDSSYPQPKEGMTYARKVKPENGFLDWEKDTALTIERKYRAYDGFVDLYTFWKDMKILIIEIVNIEGVNMDVLVTQSPVSPGFCYFHKRRKVIFVKCQDGWCGVKTLKIPKTGTISAQDFYNGFMSKVKENQCYFAVNKK